MLPKTHRELPQRSNMERRPIDPAVAENSPRVAPEKQHGAASDNTSSLPNIAVSEFYF